MPIDLTKFERSSGEPVASSMVLTDRLGRLQLAQVVHHRRAILVFEGWTGSGKRAAIRQLAASWDPCWFATHCPSTEEQDRHWLARFWALLPGAGHSQILNGSWYRHVVAERIAGRLTDKAWARRCDEINEFEAQQSDHGTLLVKLFFHVTEAIQDERLAERAGDPWQRWLGVEAPAPAPRAIQQEVWTDLLSHTDTRWAPWTLIDANGADAGAGVALAAVTEAFEKVIPQEPPGEQRVVPMAQKSA